MTFWPRFALCFFVMGCGPAEPDAEPASVDSATCALRAEDQDWNGDGVPEVRETYAEDGLIVSAEWFSGTVDGFSRTYIYDANRRLELVETTHERGMITEVYPIFEGDLVVAVRRVRTDPEGVSSAAETTLGEPCGAPWRCLEEC